MRIRTFVTTEDLLTLQTCCKRAGVMLEIGGAPEPVNLRMDGFERTPEDGRKGGRVDWSVCYITCEDVINAIHARVLFQDQLATVPV